MHSGLRAPPFAAVAVLRSSQKHHRKPGSLIGSPWTTKNQQCLPFSAETNASARQIRLASSIAHIPSVGLAVLHSRTRYSVTHWIIKKISIVTFDWIVFSVGAGVVLVVGRMPVSRPRLVFMRPRLAAEWGTAAGCRHGRRYPHLLWRRRWGSVRNGTCLLKAWVFCYLNKR